MSCGFRSWADGHECKAPVEVEAEVLVIVAQGIYQAEHAVMVEEKVRVYADAKCALNSGRIETGKCLARREQVRVGCRVHPGQQLTVSDSYAVCAGRQRAVRCEKARGSGYRHEQMPETSTSLESWSA